MGTTIRQIVEGLGGGMRDGRTFKAVQIGGPSGGCLPASMADTPVDYEALIEAGAMMGSGGLVVLDDTDCMVDMAHYFLQFTQNESCGKCTFCRVGTKRMLEILSRLCNGLGRMEDLGELESLAHEVRTGSLCGLGQTAPNPVLTTLKYFRQEYEAHVAGGCPAAKCVALVKYRATDDCIGCTALRPGLPRGRHPAGAVPEALHRHEHLHPLPHVRAGLPGGRHPMGVISSVVMHKLTIDGHPVQAPEGQTILQAARAAGIDIPTLCHAVPGEKGLEPSASCYACVVKVAGHKRLLPACATVVHDGMVVQTGGDEVAQARRTAVELLLSDHLGECLAPCQLACPAAWDVPGFMVALRQGDLAGAATIARAGLALPETLGWVCSAPCEKACRRNERDGTLAIRLLHRHAAFATAGEPAALSPGSAGTVAILGAGPAGLAAAHALRGPAVR